MGRSAWEVGAIVAVVAALAFAYREKMWVDSAIDAYGTVVHVEENRGCATIGHTATIEVNGYGAFERDYGPRGRPYRGDEVVVLVDQANPRVMILESDAWTNAIAALVLSVAAAIVVFRQNHRF